MEISKDLAESIPQHSLLRSVFYHLLPGTGVLLFYLLSSFWITGFGFKPTFAIILGFLLIGIPLQLLVLLREGFKLNHRISLKHVIFYKRKLPFWQYLAYPAFFIFYAILIYSIIRPISEFFLENYFYWLPEWFRNSSPVFDPATSGLIIGISFLGLFLVDGLINPVVEEFYFRGFLLPRISRFGYRSPFINAILFSIAHFWQPWNALQIFILVAPVYYIVWKKKNIYISMIVHCLANLLGASIALMEYYSG